jgi:uncharacterized protein (TIGR04222 family)
LKSSITQMMNILLDNLVAQMYGPYFLIFYGTIIVLIAIATNWFLQDSTAKLESLSIPKQPDPYEIVYAIAGKREVLKLAVFSLIHRGYLEVDRHAVRQVKNTPDLSKLNELESKLFHWFNDSHTGEQLIYESFLLSNVAKKYIEYQQCLENEKLVYSQQDRDKANKIALIGSLIVLGLGSYKLISALSRGHYNIGFLILMAIGGIIWLLIITQKFNRRLTERGENYRDRLKQTFAGLRGELPSPPTEVDFNTMLVVAIFGLEVLAKTPYENYLRLFVSASSSSNSRNSSSSDSGSSSGSSCVSSCGGGSSCGSSCGGGGCGGCGGCGG